MLPRIRTVLPIARQVVSLNGGSVTYAATRLASGGYHPPKNYRQSTMNDFPVPEGSWKDQYDRNQRKYNMHLVFGISFLVFSITVAKTSGLIFLNYYPPEKPLDY